MSVGGRRSAASDGRFWAACMQRRWTQHPDSQLRHSANRQRPAGLFTSQATSDAKHVTVPHHPKPGRTTCAQSCPLLAAEVPEPRLSPPPPLRCPAPAPANRRRGRPVRRCSCPLTGTVRSASVAGSSCSKRDKYMCVPRERDHEIQERAWQVGEVLRPNVLRLTAYSPSHHMSRVASASHASRTLTRA